MEFPVFWIRIFRLLMLGAMGWLSYGVVPRAAALFFTIKKQSSFFRRLVWVFSPTLRGQY